MDPVITGAAANVSSEVAKGIFQEIKRHMRYVIISKQNVDKFEEKLKSLIAKRTSVQQEVDVADRNGEKIKADVEHWCNTVDKVINEEEKKVKDLEDKAKNKCFFGLCPNIKSRYQLSKKAEKGAVVVDNLIQECQFNGVGCLDVPKAIVDTSPNGFETFKSREKVFNDIMEAMKDATISMIGVYGMPGVGKTSLVKEVARQVQEARLFDSVVTVTVAQTPDIQKIQENISELLGLRLEDKSTDVRARRLHERLKKEKTVLIVLDDIWKRLDFKEVGIAFGNQHKGCKILLTSRDQNVLSNEMDVEKRFAIDDLDDEEAWDLFRKMVGTDSVENAELRPTAIEVAKKCARLPLAIVTVARALRNKSLFAWKDALRQLQKPSSSNFTGKFAAIYLAIELSYNHLENELKQAFLLCSLVRRDASTDDFLRYAIGLGLIKGDDTVEEARNKLLTMVSDLKASCLLVDSNTYDLYFDMHDLVYDVAMSIAFKDNHAFALKEVYKDWPHEETTKKCNKIYLRFPNIRELPEELNCPQLVFFHMFIYGYKKVPPNFFKETTNLKVLHLNGMQFSSSPSSIRLLTSLCALCLHQCKLGDIAIIGELNNLKILSFSRSDIKILPKEIGRLVKLSLLDLSYCTELKIISPDVLSNLSKLEELYMDGTLIQWEDGRDANHRSNASLAELKNLSHLTTLEVHITDVEATSGGLFFEGLQKLERYKIFIGNEWNWLLTYEDEYKYSRNVRLQSSTFIDHLDHGIKMLLKKSVSYSFYQTEDDSVAKYPINDNDATNRADFSQLQLGSPQDDDSPKDISFCFEDKNVSTSMPQPELPLSSEKMGFPCLENLQLSSTNVEKIWHNASCNLENLTTLTVWGCGYLKQFLSFSMARRLVHLIHLEIIECQCLREIISTEDVEEESKTIEFPSLESLRIRDCPELKGFIYKSTTEGSQHFSSQALFNDKVAFPSLEEIFISNLRSIKMICQNQLSANSFHKLQRVEVKECPGLLTIFPSNTLRAFQGLQTLVVERCDLLEEVFEIERSNMEETRAATIQLKELFLEDLPNLKYIWKNDPQGIFTFENLQVLSVGWCLNLKNVFPAAAARVLQQLSYVDIHDCGLEEIVSKEDGLETAATFEFDQLSFFRLFNLPELKCFYPEVHTTKWPMLKVFQAFRCGNMKIVGTERFNIIETPNFNGQLESLLIHPQFFSTKKQPWSLDDLPTTVALTMHQGSTVTSMDFHPSNHTLLLVGSANGEITLWELGMRAKLVTKPFKIWEMSTCSMTFQALMVNDAPISVRRVTWSPDGSLVGVAFSKHLIHLYAYLGSNDLIQRLEIDAHIGGVNDLAFAHPFEALRIITCGDDKRIKVWDVMTGQKLFKFRVHDAPVYSICPMDSKQFISTTVDGEIILQQYDMRFTCTNFTPGHGCSTTLYNADGNRLFFCGTSKDGQSFLAEYSGILLKGNFVGFTKKSAGVVSFDMAQNQFLAAGEDSQIKFWHTDHRYPLSFTDANGGLPSLPCVRFSKEGNLLAVTTADNGFKILANAVGLKSLGPNEASSSSAKTFGNCLILLSNPPT
ncbi:hypothetical protein POUND7_000112 [Theobroma cacao]